MNENGNSNTPTGVTEDVKPAVDVTVVYKPATVKLTCPVCGNRIEMPYEWLAATCPDRKDWPGMPIICSDCCTTLTASDNIMETREDA